MSKLMTAVLLAALVPGAAFAHEDSQKMKMDDHKGMGMMKHMESLDANGDAMISKQEFTSHHEKMFQMMDKNKDSMLSPDEHHMMMKMMGAGMMKSGGMGHMDGMSMTGDTDYDFAANMRKHHQVAVDMSQGQLKNGKHPQMLQMAKDIIAAQKKEIAVLDQWMKAHGKP